MTKGYDLPNGWRITPIGKAVATEDLILNVSVAPDKKAIVALHGGFNPNGLVVIDPVKEEAVQRIPLKSAWLGLAWSRDGKQLFVSGGNAMSRQNASVAPVYVFDYANGRLSEKPVAEITEPGKKPADVYWSGIAQHPAKDLIYAANRGNDPLNGYVAVIDTKTRKMVGKIDVEASPYDLVFSADGKTLYVSNWSSDSISVIDTESGKVTGRIATGDNPNDIELLPDGRLLVACGNENSVTVIDTKDRDVIEKISVALTKNSPPGATPNALVVDRANNMLFVANADNNAIAVVNIATPGRSRVLGFIPSGWYPSALALNNGRLVVGNSKGLGSYSDERGPHSPLPKPGKGEGSVKSLQKGSVNFVALASLKQSIDGWTKQVYENTPYKDEYLAKAKAPATAEPTIVPQSPGVGSPIKHILYILKENRTYDQVFGDIKKGNGEPAITIFGEQITPNQHALVNEYVLLDNLYCDGEVSVDGHSWSNSAIATDYNEKLWPPNYGGHSKMTRAEAYVPAGGHLWDVAKKAGLTIRSYGEYSSRSSDGTTMEASPGVGGLLGAVSPKFKLPGMRDTDNVKVFLEELEEYEKNFDSKDPNRRLPNYMVMSLPEDHTNGTRPGSFTPRAMVANNDWAIGQLVERLTKSKYWPQMAVFIIEDDAQDGSDHVDARRTAGLVISPYTKRNFVDSTLYTTSGMLRTMELLLGLPPMTQNDAAAMPMYKLFSNKMQATPFQAIAPKIDVNEKNLVTAWGAKKSMEMNLDDIDEAPMREFNEIIWKSVKGEKSEMPPPVHRFHFARLR
jgi:YVTN family beta-propeller protein